jgi:hypothetical protein
LNFAYIIPYFFDFVKTPFKELILKALEGGRKENLTKFKKCGIIWEDKKRAKNKKGGAAMEQKEKVMDVEIITQGNFHPEEQSFDVFSGVPSVVEEKDYFVEEIEKAEKRLEALARQRMLIIKLTRPYDWIRYGESAYLTAYGAERLVQVFNISYHIGEPEIKYHEDGHFTVIIRGTFTWGERTIEEIGIRSSKDKFFSKVGTQSIPPHQIKLSDVVKAARSNLIARGVATLLGLRGLSVADVSKMIGKVEKQVEFKKKAEQSS